MDADRWRKLEELFDKVLDCPLNDRTAFLNRACADNPTLKQRMLSVKRIILGLLLLIAFALGSVFIWQQQPKSLPLFVAPPNWREIDLGYFLFYLPPDMTPDNVQGIDSEVWQYSNNSTQLNIDWGIYPGAFEPYSYQPEYLDDLG